MSQKTIAHKLFIKEGNKVLFINQPEEYLSIIGDLPKNIVFPLESEDNLDFIQVFVKNKAELEKQLPILKEKIKVDGIIWISYLKGTSKIKTDINRDNIRKYALTLGLKTVSMISINKDWSAMRLKILDV